MTQNCQSAHMMSVKEFVKGAQTTTLVEDVYAEIEKHQCEELIDPDRLRRDQDWSKLNGQVFGHEITP